MFRNAFLAIGLLWIATHAHAQSFPGKPVHLVVPQLSGGSSDVLARMIADRLRVKWGQAVVVENKPGANGNIGTEAVIRTPADGYTLLMQDAGTHSLNPALFSNLRFDAQKDLVPIVTVATVPFLLVVPAELPANSVQELIAMARRDPGKLNYGAQNGAMPHILGAMLNRAGKMDTVFVPYRGARDSLTDTLAGRLQFNFGTIGSLKPHVEAGKLRALAITSAKRAPQLPDLPTIAEVGMPELTTDYWYAIFAPTGTPREIVEQVRTDVLEIVSSKEVATNFNTLGLQPFVTTPAAFTELLRVDAEKYRNVVKQAAIKVEQ
jgi:tripartite-type tricarboxylate transporter receptor subunit TctC